MCLWQNETFSFMPLASTKPKEADCLKNKIKQKKEPCTKDRNTGHKGSMCLVSP